MRPIGRAWSLGIRSKRLSAALRHSFGGFLLIAFLASGTPPALAESEADLTATSCDGWWVTLTNWQDDARVSISVDGQTAVSDAPFASGFSLGGDWPGFQAYHSVFVSVTGDGLNWSNRAHARDCPESAPTTTTTTTTTQAPPPTTTVTLAPTTTTEASSSVSSLVTSTTVVVASTVVPDAADADESDVTVVAGADTGSSSGSGVALVLVGLTSGVAIAGGVGGAWYLGRRSTRS